MYLKTISFFYNLKKEGKLKFLFLIYRYLITIYIFLNLKCKNFYYYFLNLFNFDLTTNHNYLDFCLIKLTKLIDKKKFNKKKFNFYKKQSYQVFEKLVSNRTVNDLDFINITMINKAVGDFINWEKNKKLWLDWLIRSHDNIPNNIPKEMQNIRFVDARYIFNNIGFVYSLDAWIKSIYLGFSPKYEIYCLVYSSIRAKPINRFIIKKLSKYIKFIYEDKLIRKYKPYERILDSNHTHFLKLKDSYAIYAQSGGIAIQQMWNKKGLQPLFRLTKEEIEHGWLELSKCGIKKSDWFVTIHVRDSSFKGHEIHRDVDIENYYKSFESITSRGGWVIRLGDPKIKPLPKMPNVLDYPFTEIRSDMMDVFLSAESRFLIGTSSGMSAISYIFDTPIAMTNYQPLTTLYLREKDLYLPRLLKFKKNNEYGNFNKLFKLPYSYGTCDGFFQHIIEVDVITNTEDEISELVEEMINKTNNEFELNENRSLKQQKIDLIIKNNNSFLFKDLNFKTKIGEKFLERHKDLF